jgi:hypothetical protein
MKENKEYQNQLFRLAVVLYADNNYDVKIGTIHKKIIESVLLECEKKEFSINQIIDFCQENYKIVFDENTIRDIVNKNINEFLSTHKNDEIFVCLSEKRKQALNSKISNRTIDFFISEFINKYQNLTKNVDTQSVIYKFLYEVFNSNAKSFKKLIDNKNFSEAINAETTNYTDKEKEIINNFLQWDNAVKNKTIFDISSYALEYCMLTNKKGGNSIQINNLRNKIFYLDTNIIYRALGINGENRKKRSATFLNKFSESNEQLIISKSTDTEFRDSIKSHIDRIKKYNSPRVNSKVYQQFSNKIQPDIYNFYHNWRIGKTNTSLELFEAYVLGLYDSLTQEHKIIVDYKIPYDVKDKKSQDKIRDYSSEIYNFKSKERLEVAGSSEVDAENIFLVECKREGRVVNLFDTKYFLISTDQGLRRWDYQRLNQTPIVLLPSQWLSILLRYVNRTEDDFKSFVSFLNLKSNEVLIDNEKLQIVIAGISEMTTDLEAQKNLLNALIENKFNDVISKTSSNDDIYNKSKSYAKTKLEQQIEEQSKTIKTLSDSNSELEVGQKNLSQKFDKHKKETDVSIKKIVTTKDTENKKLVDENIFLKEKLTNKEVEDEIRKWQKPLYLFIPLIIIIIAFFLLQIFFTCYEWNFVQKLIDFIDNNPSETKKDWMQWLLNGGLLTGLGFLIKSSWTRLFKKKEKGQSIRENLTRKDKLDV